MSLTKSERRTVQEPLFLAMAQVTRVLPEVVAEGEWDLCAGLDGIWLKFKGSGPNRHQSLLVDVIYYERKSGPITGDDRRDVWKRGVVSFVSDGRPEDTDPMEHAQNFWRACVLEELAAALVGHYPKGAAELRKVAEYLRRPEALH